MSTISTSSSTAARTNFERLQMVVTTAGSGIGLLIMHTLLGTMSPKELTFPYSILFYFGSLLIGGFLSDYFSSWILFLGAIEIGSVLTTTLFLLYTASTSASGNIGALVFFTFALFSITSWLAAAKHIKNSKPPSIPPSQQHLWWTLLTACSSVNIPSLINIMWLTQQHFWSVVGLSTPLLLILIVAVGYMTLYTYYNRELTRNGDDQGIYKAVTFEQLLRVSFVKSHEFWFIVILNALLVTTKWTVGSIVFPEYEEGVLIEGMKLILHHHHQRKN